jgi:hypothetical protein
MEEDNMNYYDTPEQPIDPPQMSKGDEIALESAEKIVSEINKLYDFVETYFEEISVAQIEKKLYKAEEYLEDLESLYDATYVVQDEYKTGKWMVEEIEGWLHEKEDLIKTEGDK